MQGTNQTFNKKPKAGDGTLHEPEAEPQATWFGATLEPQEEYINSGVDEVGPTPEDERRLPQTEANAESRPMVSAQARRTKSGTPPAPHEVFPFGDPCEQSDG